MIHKVTQSLHRLTETEIFRLTKSFLAKEVGLFGKDKVKDYFMLKRTWNMTNIIAVNNDSSVLLL